MPDPNTSFPGVLSSLGFPYIIEVEYDGSSVLRQPLGMELTPANDVLSYLLTGRLRPRHFAGECAHESPAVSLHDSTMSKFEVRKVIVLFGEIYFEYRSRLVEFHLAPALRPVPGVSLSLTSAFHPFSGRMQQTPSSLSIPPGSLSRFMHPSCSRVNLSVLIYLPVGHYCPASAPARLSEKGP